jgi:hypothetical protein
MAQVTLSGKYAFAYQSTTTAAGVTTKGGETTDGDIVFAATEDLGGGMSISASSALRLRGRTPGSTDGRDASMTLSGGFGKVMIGSIEAGNGILGLGGAGAPVIGLDSSKKTLSGAGNIDLIRYYTPELAPGLTAYISSIEGVVGAGGSTSASTQVGVSYSAGALKVSGDVVNYATGAATAAVNGICAVVGGATTAISTATLQTTCATAGGVVTAYTAATTLATAKDQQTRISASYNLGVATVGVGYQLQSFQLAGTADNKQTVVGLSAPVGNMTVGVLFATQKQGTTVDLSGTEIGVKYALSKRTNLQVANQSYKSGTASSAKATRVRLMHSF